MTDDAITETLFVGACADVAVEVFHQIDARGSTRTVFVDMDGGELPLSPAMARRLAAVLTAAAEIAEGGHK